MRVAAFLACLMLAAADGASAQVSDAPRPTRRVIPVAPSRPPDPAPAPSTPSPDVPGRLGLGGLSNLGTLGGPGDGGATCRSGCARVRYACEMHEEGCAASWGACVRGCAASQTSATGALLPR